MRRIRLDKNTLKKTTLLTFMGVVPGAFFIAGIYLLAHKMRSNYRHHKLENPNSEFKRWLKDHGYTQMKGEFRDYVGDNYKTIRTKLTAPIKICEKHKKELH